MYHGTETVIVASKGVDHCLNFPAIGEFYTGSGSVSERFFQQIASYLLRLSQEDLLEAIDIVKRPAVDHLRAGVNDHSLHEPSIFAQSSVAFPPAANDVVTLQGESGRIDLHMAGIAGIYFPMLVELLANRRRSADVGLDGRDIVRWQGYVLAKDTFEHPYTADHR